MNRFTVEETNLISIYMTGTRQELIEEMTAALPLMDNDMRELAQHTIEKVSGMTEDEYLRLAIEAAEDE